MGVVAEVADRVLVMRRGKKVEEGEACDIFANPKEKYTRFLLAAVPSLGSMRGTDEPAPFALMADEDPERQSARPIGTVPQTFVPRQSEPILKVRDLTTRFVVERNFFGRPIKRVHAVERVSFDLFPAETLALVGESGSGKTTTGRTLLRLVESKQGSVEFNGQDISNLSRRGMQSIRRNMQIIFQDPFASLNPRMTVGSSIMEPLLIHGVGPGAEARKKVRTLMDRCGLSPNMANRYPHEFSGGQRQRICIARALALNPKVIIADESVSALDVSIQAQIINLLMTLQKEFGISILFISHDMAVVERMSHRVAVMYLGQIVEIGSRRDIFENSQHPYTIKLLDAVPVADPRIARKQRPLLIDEIPSPVRHVSNEPMVQPLVRVGPAHFVAKHSIGIY